jgi:uncharacterized protein GlcG (DUF336 family)
MDGAKAVSVIFATNKAFTVLAYKMGYGNGHRNEGHHAGQVIG